MRFLDFFAGIGGFRLGLEMAGHECVGHIEIDKYANKSYVAMHRLKESEFFATDVRGVIPGELPEADCYCGGFPCQSFSVAGKRGGFEDTRGTLLFEVLRLAKVRKPKYLFLENVAGLLSHDRGKTFGVILTALDELGYGVEWQVLNSKNFGVPQNRERVFIIGHLGGGSGGKVFPIGGDDEKANVNEGHTICANTLTTRTTADSVGSYVIESQQYAQEVKPQDRHGVMIKLANENGNHYGGGLFDKDGISPTLQSSGGGGGTNNIPKIVDNLDRHGVMINQLNNPTHSNDRVYGTDGISPTLNTMQGGLRQPFINNNCRIRRLTPRECFRLQGFPDEYFERAASVNSDSQLYKQSGNSVTVNVIYEIAKRLEV